MSQETMQHYWEDLSARHLDVSDEGLAAICYAGMPEWFNRFLDVYQRKAMARLLQGEDFAGSRILDIGTGVGRWARWFADRDAGEVVGIDLEPARLAHARAYGGPVTYLEMPIDSLAFADGTFDVVNCVTVLQHVTDPVKQLSIAEIARVLAPRGKAVVFEETHTADDAAHVFPWSKTRWQEEFNKNGLHVIRTVGDQYTPLLRVLKTAFSIWKGKQSRTEIETLKNSGSGHRMTLRLLQAAVMASYPVEEIARFLPPGFAKITGFYLEKR